MRRDGIVLHPKLSPNRSPNDVGVIRFSTLSVVLEATRSHLQKLANEVCQVHCCLASLFLKLLRVSVIALDTNPTRLALARHNAAIYGVADRIEFILTDYLTFVQSYLTLPSPENRKIDVVFLSPPWGGPSYLSNSTNDAISQAMTYDDRLSEDALPVENYPEYSLSSIQPIHGAKLFQLSRQISRNIAYFLPRNSKLEEISSLLVDENSGESTKENSKETNNSVLEMVEVEEEWMGTKLKALTCYFGGLASGQEHLF